MVNEVMKFENETLSVQFVARECNGMYLFPAAPIVKALGYTNLTDIISKQVFPEYQFRFRNIRGMGGRPTVFLSEPGLYQLVMRSKMPKARTFQKWVFEEVLPSIHHNGGYISGQEKLAEDEKKQLLVQIRKLADDNKRLIGENKKLRQDLNIREKAFDKLSERVIDIANDIVYSSMENSLFDKK